MSVGKIEPYEIAQDTFNKLWNVQVCDYNYNSAKSDFEGLCVRVSCERAATIEAEITPVSTLVRRRNEQLEDLGNALSDLTGAQKTLEDEESKVTTADVDAKTYEVVNTLKTGLVQKSSDGRYTVNKATCGEAIELVKTRMDKLNNDSQSDMTRLQSLVDRRDSSFETASSLSSSISDTRGNAIKNMC